VANALTPEKHATLEAFNDYVAGPVGKIFLNLLFMVVIPLVFASVTLGIAGLGDLRRVGRIGAKTLLYFLVTTLVSALLGIAMMNGIRPGEGFSAETREELLATFAADAAQREVQAMRGFGIDTFVNMIPRNPFAAAAGTDLLGVLVFSIFLGIALTPLPQERTKPLLGLLDALGQAMVKIIDLVMRFAPIGVAGLIFVVTSKFGGKILGQLAAYVVLVLAALVFHLFVVLSAAVRIAGGLDPLRFFSKIRAVLVTAFSTSSSNATLPTTITTAERNLRIPTSVAGFVLPLGATMNMNGTSLFEGMTVLFLAQVFGIELSLAQQLQVVVLCVIMAIGAAGVPGGSIPLVMIILEQVGLPGGSIAVILGVDRILDMTRTVPNVVGDLTAACFVARSEKLWSPDLVGGKEGSAAG
jgi:DAACS family dicarboxylate/amino acid:cation (Na+ or H+) symporter